MNFLNALSGPIIRRLRGCGPEEYLGYITWILVVMATVDLMGAGRYAVPIQVFGGGLVLGGSIGRLSDAGFSRWWACVVLPTVTAPWLVPLLIPGAMPRTALAQLFESLRMKNPYHIALALVLLSVPALLATLRKNPVSR